MTLPSRRIQSRETVSFGPEASSCLSRTQKPVTTALRREAGVRDLDGRPVEARRQHGKRRAVRGGDPDVAEARLRRTVERRLAAEHRLPCLVSDDDRRLRGRRLARPRERPVHQDPEQRLPRPARRSPARAARPLPTRPRAPRSTTARIVSADEPRVGRREDPAPARARPAKAVDLEQRARARQPLGVQHVNERARDALARPRGAVLARQVLLVREPQRQRPRTPRLGQRPGPARALGRHGLQRRGERREVELLRGADQQLVCVRRLAEAGDVAALLEPDRLVQRCAAEHDQSPAGAHEVADRRPGVHGKRAAVRQARARRSRAA